MYATITLTDIVLLIFSIGREFCVPVTSCRISLDSPSPTQLDLIADILILYLTRFVIIVEFFSNIALIAKTIEFGMVFTFYCDVVIVYLHL